MSDKKMSEPSPSEEHLKIMRAIKAKKRANEQLACESNASLCSGAGRKAPANDPDVQGTGLPGFAELRARAEKVKQRARLERADFKARKMKYHEGVSFGEFRLAVELLRWLDELSGCEG
jgi:hypothetical protein